MVSDEIVDNVRNSRRNFNEGGVPVKLTHEAAEEAAFFGGPFHGGQVCYCGAAFPMVRPQNREVCRRCGIPRPEYISPTVLRHTHAHDFFALAVAGRANAYPVWHPISVPTHELTDFLKHPRVKRNLRSSTSRALMMPSCVESSLPSFERPLSATSGEVQESVELGLSRPRSAGALRLLKGGADTAERITCRYANKYQSPSSKTPSPHLLNAASCSNFSTWTPGRFTNWMNATKDRRLNWPLQNASNDSDDDAVFCRPSLADLSKMSTDAPCSSHQTSIDMPPSHQTSTS